MTTSDNSIEDKDWLDDLFDEKGVTRSYGDSYETEFLADLKQALQSHLKRAELRAKVRLIQDIKNSDVKLNIGTRDLLSHYSQELNKDKIELLKGLS